MVREKRPAENPAVGRSKRQKVANKVTCSSSPIKEHPEHTTTSQNSVAESVEDEEGLTQEIQSRLDGLKLDNVNRKKAAKEFEDRVKREQTRLTRKIEIAKEKIGERQDDFKTQMMPILAAALQGPRFQQAERQQASSAIVTGSKPNMDIIQGVKDTLRSCSELVTCYKSVVEIPAVEPSVARIRSTFEMDKDESLRAVESAKKMIINKLQSRLADKTVGAEERFVLDDDEHHLARKILSRSNGENPPRGSVEMGPLLYSFGKIVGKMRDIVHK